jgi:bacterioferritin (cytochrome b1)
MMTPDAIRRLNRLLAIHCRSFVQYLRWSRPYVPEGRQETLETLEAIAQDQDALADRISRMIVDAGALPHTGEFPMEFTDLHDLSLDFLIAAAVRYQEFDLATIQEIVDGLTPAPAARALAEEALGMSKGHLDSLRELVHPPVIPV